MIKKPIFNKTQSIEQLLRTNTQFWRIFVEIIRTNNFFLLKRCNSNTQRKIVDKTIVKERIANWETVDQKFATFGNF